MEKDINITVIDREGKNHHISAPTDMSMNLMEVCKGFELPVEGICGGMAMCASLSSVMPSSRKWMAFAQGPGCAPSE